MSGVLDIQRRHQIVFKVRFGEKVNGAPRKLQGKLRITSENEDVVKAFADKYGGQVKPWSEGGFEVYIPRSDLPIMILPGQSVDQSWEKYAGSVCERRCQGWGGTEQISGKSCMCDPDVNARIADRNQCTITTRINFICPEVPTMGAGQLVTRGLIAAETLPQAVAVVEKALAMGEMLPATLRAVQKVGKNRQYVIPQLEITGVSLNELMSNSPGGSDTALNSPSAEGRTALPATSAASGVEEKRSLGAALKKAPMEAPSSSAGTYATDQQRQMIYKTASLRRVNSEALEALILDKTGKYVDESEFSLDDVNAVLDALNQKDN